jgi:hypothetical protein
MSFSQHIVVMSVGQNVRTIEGMEAKLGEGIGTIQQNLLDTIAGKRLS